MRAGERPLGLGAAPKLGVTTRIDLAPAPVILSAERQGVDHGITAGGTWPTSARYGMVSLAIGIAGV
jgi:hypothetical protein